MSDLNNAVSSVAKVVGGCLPDKQLPGVPLPPAVILPALVAGVAVGATAFAVRSLAEWLFD